MPTNRTRRVRRRKNSDMPAWARTMIETGEIPEMDDNCPNWSAFIGWYYLGEEVPGLPKPSEFERKGNKINWKD